MEKSSSISKKQRLINKLIPATIFIFLAIVATDMSNLFRIVSAIAGVTFAIEGLVRFRKDKQSEAD